jgi:pimeloyl-ACP methyl ester carboxylesterase
MSRSQACRNVVIPTKRKTLWSSFRAKGKAIRSIALNSTLCVQVGATDVVWGVASMTIVLVHGNPETEAIWDDLVPQLRSDDVVRLSPPGFGCAIPPGFECSTDAYRDWLAGELGKLTQPIDLVGHDWGGGHVVRIAMERPDLIRSWTSDILGCFDADYLWHDMASVPTAMLTGNGQSLLDLGRRGSRYEYGNLHHRRQFRRQREQMSLGFGHAELLLVLGDAA